MKLTPQQEAAITNSGHTLLVACPGSGKTRAITARLLRCVDDVRGTPRKVACITYTNAAVHEIEHRLRQFGSTGDEDYSEVSTIHAFCLNNVIRHFSWKIKEYANGFCVLPSDSDEYLQLVQKIGDKYEIDAYPRQMFDSLNRKPNGDPMTPDGIPDEAAIEFWSELQKEGYIDFCNIVYYSYCLLRDNVSLAANLASRYASILIDEFQDTSDLQVHLLRLLFEQGSSEFFLVGDPEQSIYSFAGAQRELMFQFSNAIGAKRFHLSGNFRSSEPIVKCAEKLIARESEMLAVGGAKDFSDNPTYEHFATNFEAITDRFLPVIEELKIPLGKCAILCHNWFQLMPLGNQLREYGVPVVGPGARPYKKRHLFASLAEQVCAYVDNPKPEFITPAERELFFLVQNLTGNADFRIFTYDGRRVLFRLLHEGQRLREDHEGAKDWLLAASEVFSDVLCSEDLLPRKFATILPESVSDILQDMQDKDVDVENLTLNDLGMFANPANNLKLLTMHGAKGREFSAVAVISVLDGMVPYHNYYNPITDEGLAESRRLLYVSITRAKRLLMLFSKDDSKRPPSRFLKNLGFIE